MEDDNLQPERYNGWLVSNSLLKRSFAVAGHYFFAWIIIGGAMLIFAFLIGLLLGSTT